LLIAPKDDAAQPKFGVVRQDQHFVAAAWLSLMNVVFGRIGYLNGLLAAAVGPREMRKFAGW
jgi:hypothetical protein